ncbi:MAG TPA: XdhC family protein [Povalibacter sp.]|uniref:XdhC family protein n=1 Tax=Povalibacter sp. TaxID=1962978 RepID=UPI002CCB93B1|nr:XdhC family protein [Povalibacter sp.]HMN43391.1 XdhC family protein [Povalibacter sp.]
MNHRPVSLGEFFRLHRERGEPLVLATIIHTIGSTYRKAGAQMLIAQDASAAGLLSGGCLEADLVERSRKVLETGNASIAEYDTRSSDDLIWGIGLGCEGAMRILLTRLNAANDYEPYAFVDRCRNRHIAGSIALVTASTNPRFALGAAFRSDEPGALPAAVQTAIASAGSAATVNADDIEFLIVPVELPPKLLILGAGPDAMPLVEIAGLMGWHITVLDHRPAYAIVDRFPRARSVELRPAATLSGFLDGTRFDAAVVMSHHLTSDEAYLAALADSAIPYIGLLGPAPRRVRLMNDIGERATRFGNRLYGPIGLDIGAKTPESIALAIVAEIQAVLANRPGRSFSTAGSGITREPQKTA